MLVSNDQGSTMSASAGSAIVTGASSGIGAVYADRLAARGHDVILVARRRDRLDSLAEKLRAQHGHAVDVVVADLADPAGVARVEAEIRDRANLAILVNNAGLGALGPSAAVEASAVDIMLKVNVLALTRLSLAAARRFAAVRQGTIINLGSVVAVMLAPSASGYSGSKAYVLSFSRGLQAELKESGVRVQVVMPGPVHSEFFGDTPPPFPDELMMTAEALVDTAFAALDQGETVTFPNLHDVTAWQQFESARGSLVKAVTQNGIPATRYGAAPVMAGA